MPALGLEIRTPPGAGVTMQPDDQFAGLLPSAYAPMEITSWTDRIWIKRWLGHIHDHYAQEQRKHVQLPKTHTSQPTCDGRTIPPAVTSVRGDLAPAFRFTFRRGLPPLLAEPYRLGQV